MAGVMLRLFFRRIEVEGLENVPAAGPILLVPNHTNALVDPLLLVTTLKRRVTVTVKNVLGKNPLLALVLRGGRSRFSPPPGRWQGGRAP